MAEKVVSINPRNIAAYNNLCAANIMLGEFDKAIAAANKALEIDPNYQLTKNNLQWAKDVKASSQKK
jgi:Flp pilus assembly protein TadD